MVIILVVHLLIAIALVGAILLQKKEGGLGGLGGGENRLAVLALQALHLLARHVHRDLAEDAWLLVRVHEVDAAAGAEPCQRDRMLEGAGRRAGSVHGYEEFHGCIVA